MLTAENLIQKCHALARTEADVMDADSLIGFFQIFRPDPAGLTGLFEHLDVEPQLHQRLDQLYTAAGDGRRGDGSFDAYFIVRQPPAIDPDQAQQLAQTWLHRLGHLARRCGETALADALDPVPTIRVLEGLAPKHPKGDERCRLLKAIKDQASQLLQRHDDQNSTADALRPAYYFIACDAMLRDYLMWPLHSGSFGGDEETPDPFEPYFQLWCHGIKYRIFGDRQVDLYLPRQ